MRHMQITAPTPLRRERSAQHQWWGHDHRHHRLEV